MSKKVFEEASLEFWDDKNYYLTFFGHNALGRLLKEPGMLPFRSIKDPKAKEILDWIIEFIEIDINEHRELGEPEYERLKGEVSASIMIYHEIIRRFS